MQSTFLLFLLLLVLLLSLVRRFLVRRDWNVSSNLVNVKRLFLITCIFELLILFCFQFIIGFVQFVIESHIIWRYWCIEVILDRLSMLLVICFISFLHLTWLFLYFSKCLSYVCANFLKMYNWWLFLSLIFLIWHILPNLTFKRLFSIQVCS